MEPGGDKRFFRMEQILTTINTSLDTRELFEYTRRTGRNVGSVSRSIPGCQPWGKKMILHRDSWESVIVFVDSR